jgi:hypothetical protein
MQFPIYHGRDSSGIVTSSLQNVCYSLVTVSGQVYKRPLGLDSTVRTVKQLTVKIHVNYVCLYC